MITTYTTEQLEDMYQGMTGSVHVQATFITEVVGGQPADRKGIESYVKYHLKITDPTEAQKAADRIEKEEIGERDVTPEAGEVAERSVYNINILRHTDKGAWLGDWMVN
jgi:hypothetical protein